MFQVISGLITIIVCYAIYIIMYRRKQKKEEAESVLDDTSYIQEIQHLSGKVGFILWQQYDILLAARNYFWEVMVDYADYLEKADLDNIDSLRVADMTEDSFVELAHVYNQSKVGLKNFDKLKEERGSLSIAGHSRTLNDSVKIVWYNQTRVIRLFTPINDETLVRKYVETLIRQSFGTKDAMKLAKPVESKQNYPIASKFLYQKHRYADCT